VPALLLQPLVENAIYHGIEPLPEGGVVRIEGAQADGLIALTVTNPLSPPRALPESGPNRRTGHHMAIDNIRERLRLHYGRRARLEVTTGDGVFTARLEIPYLTERDQGDEGADHRRRAARARPPAPPARRGRRGIEIVGEAADGRQALELNAALAPTSCCSTSACPASTASRPRCTSPAGNNRRR
jgi:hypothetical protein